MNLLKNNKNRLNVLFASFTMQEAILVKQNLESTLSLLKVPSQKILLMLQEQDFSIEQLLSNKCLPLIRFYLGDQEFQKRHFLDIRRLSSFFNELPVVEAFIFKKHIDAAQGKLKIPDQELQKLLLEEGLIPSESVNAPKKQLSGKTGLKRIKALLNDQSDIEEQAYSNRYYEIKGGHLCLVNDQKEYGVEMLLYSELSPFQQIEAQKIVKSSSAGEAVKT